MVWSEAMLLDYIDSTYHMLDHYKQQFLWRLPDRQEQHMFWFVYLFHLKIKKNKIDMKKSHICMMK